MEFEEDLRIEAVEKGFSIGEDRTFGLAGGSGCVHDDLGLHRIRRAQVLGEKTRSAVEALHFGGIVVERCRTRCAVDTSQQKGRTVGVEVEFLPGPCVFRKLVEFRCCEAKIYGHKNCSTAGGCEVKLKKLGAVFQHHCNPFPPFQCPGPEAGRLFAPSLHPPGDVHGIDHELQVIPLEPLKKGTHTIPYSPP